MVMMDPGQQNRGVNTKRTAVVGPKLGEPEVVKSYPRAHFFLLNPSMSSER